MHALPQIAQWHDVDFDTIKNEIAPLHRPAILKGLLKDWPIVKQAQHSAGALCEYLTKAANVKPINFIHSENKKGRLFYNDEFNGVNFNPLQASFAEAINKVLTSSTQEGDSAFYIGNASVKQYLPTILQENYNDFLNHGTQPSLWIGNQVTIAPHFDVPDNIACCISGKRKFTLFPPEQISNLYVGPLDFTPAGPPVSLVDINNPDYDKYPKFREALKHAQTAELEPGDAIYIPSLWWHNVESLEKFNVLLTYFHDATPGHYGSGFDCLLHGLMSIRNLPKGIKEAWQAYFNHYIFSDDDAIDSHIPKERLGVLGNHTANTSNGLKEMIKQGLMR